MTETIINIILLIMAIYLAAGFIFSIIFIAKGLQVLDEGAHGTGIGFKLIIVPGCIVFWPVLLKKWMKAGRNKLRQ
ncbi:MAG: hypothetical protein ABI741_06795 [Ferruginibacter sp.]